MNILFIRSTPYKYLKKVIIQQEMSISRFYGKIFRSIAFVFLYAGIMFLHACKNKETPTPAENPNDAKVTTSTDSLIYFYPTVTGNIKINVHIPKGPSVDYVFLNKIYATPGSDLLSNGAVLWKILIGGRNVSQAIDTSASFSFSDLRSDLFLNDTIPIPADEALLPDSGHWNITFKSFLSSGRNVVSDQSITVMISVSDNFFMGKYSSHIIWHGASAGTYPDDVINNITRSKDLRLYSQRGCITDFAFMINSWQMIISILPDNSITLDATGVEPDRMIGLTEGDPFDSTKSSYYDPDTGIIYLYYHYTIERDYNIIWETLTPAD